MRGRSKLDVNIKYKNSTYSFSETLEAKKAAAVEDKQGANTPVQNADLTKEEIRSSDIIEIFKNLASYNNLRSITFDDSLCNQIDDLIKNKQITAEAIINALKINSSIVKCLPLENETSGFPFELKTSFRTLLARNRAINDLKLNLTAEQLASDKVWDYIWEPLMAVRMTEGFYTPTRDPVINYDQSNEMYYLDPSVYKSFIDYIYANPAGKYTYSLQFQLPDITAAEFLETLNKKNTLFPFSSLVLKSMGPQNADVKFFDELLKFMQQNPNIKFIDMTSIELKINHSAFEKFCNELKKASLTTQVHFSSKNVNYEDEKKIDDISTNPAVILDDININNLAKKQTASNFSVDPLIAEYKRLNGVPKNNKWWTPIEEKKEQKPTAQYQHVLQQEVKTSTEIQTETQQQLLRNNGKIYDEKAAQAWIDAKDGKSITVEKNILNRIIGDSTIAKDWKITGFTESFLKQVVMRPDNFHAGLILGIKPGEYHLPEGIQIITVNGQKVLTYDPNYININTPEDIRIKPSKPTSTPSYAKGSFENFNADSKIPQVLKDEYNMFMYEFGFSNFTKKDKLGYLKGNLRLLLKSQGISDQFIQEKYDKIIDTLSYENIESLRPLVAQRKLPGLINFLDNCLKLRKKDLYPVFQSKLIDNLYRHSLSPLVDETFNAAINTVNDFAENEAGFFEAALKNREITSTIDLLHFPNAVKAFNYFFKELKAFRPELKVDNFFKDFKFQGTGENFNVNLHKILLILKEHPDRAQEQLDNLQGVDLGNDHAYYALREGYQFVTAEMELDPKFPAESKNNRFSYRVELKDVESKDLLSSKRNFFRFLGGSNTPVKIEDIREIYKKIAESKLDEKHIINLLKLIANALQSENNRAINPTNLCGELIKIIQSDLTKLKILNEKTKDLSNLDLEDLIQLTKIPAETIDPKNIKDLIAVNKTYGTSDINTLIDVWIPQKPKLDPEINQQLKAYILEQKDLKRFFAKEFIDNFKNLYNKDPVFKEYLKTQLAIKSNDTLLATCNALITLSDTITAQNPHKSQIISSLENILNCKNLSEKEKFRIITELNKVKDENIKHFAIYVLGQAAKHHNRPEINTNLSELLTELEKQTSKNFAPYFGKNCPLLSEFNANLKANKSLEDIFNQSDAKPTGKNSKEVFEEKKPLDSTQLEALLKTEYSDQSKTNTRIALEYERIIRMSEELSKFTRNELLNAIETAKKDSGNIPRLIACLRELLYRTDPEHRIANDMQIISVLNSFNHGRFALNQINTGQGKSLVCALQAGIMHCLGHTAVVLSSSPELAMRDFETFKPFFTALDTNVSTGYIEKNSPKGTFKVGGINYSTTSDFSLYWQSAKQRGESLRKKKHGTEDKPSEEKVTLSVVIDEEDDLFLSKSGRDLFILSGSVDKEDQDNTWIYDPINLFTDFLANKKTLLNSTHQFTQSEKEQGFDKLAELYKKIAAAQIPPISNEDLLNKTIPGLEIDTLSMYLHTQANTPTKANQIKDKHFPHLLKTLIQSAKSVKDNYKDDNNKNFRIAYDSKAEPGKKQHARIDILVSGRADPNLQYGNGYHQLLAKRLMKEDPNIEFTIDPIRVTISTRSPDDLIRDLQKDPNSYVLGSSGSAGSAKQIKAKEGQYGFIQMKQKPQQNSNLNEKPKIICDKKEINNEIKKVIISDKTTNRPWLIHCDDINKVNALKKDLTDLELKDFKILTLTAENIKDEKSILKQAGEPNTILISTVMRRGTDIRTLNAEGFGMINLAIQSTTEEQQIKGRVARQNDKGSYIQIVSKDEVNSLTTKYNIDASALAEVKKALESENPKKEPSEAEISIKAIQNHIEQVAINKSLHESPYTQLTRILQQHFDKWNKTFKAERKKLKKELNNKSPAPAELRKKELLAQIKTWNTRIHDLQKDRVYLLKEFGEEWQELQSSQNSQKALVRKATELWNNKHQELMARWTNEFHLEPKTLNPKIRSYTESTINDQLTAYGQRHLTEEQKKSAKIQADDKKPNEDLSGLDSKHSPQKPPDSKKSTEPDPSDTIQKATAKIFKLLADTSYSKTVANGLNQVLETTLMGEVKQAQNSFTLPPGISIVPPNTSEQPSQPPSQICELKVGRTQFIASIQIDPLLEKKFETELKNKVFSVKVHLENKNANQSSEGHDEGKVSKQDLIFADKQIRLFMSAVVNSEENKMYITLDATKSLEARNQVRALLLVCKAHNHLYPDNKIYYENESGFDENLLSPDQIKAATDSIGIDLIKPFAIAPQQQKEIQAELKALNEELAALREKKGTFKDPHSERKETANDAKIQKIEKTLALYKEASEHGKLNISTAKDILQVDPPHSGK